MNESVLISIQPKWVEKIIKGEKTVEVRKTKPNLQTPFKCYIYCTKGKTELPIERKINRELEDLCDGYEILYWANGKVIGEFTCDKIDDYTYKKDNKVYWNLEVGEFKELLKKSCLTDTQFFDYSDKSKTLYGWHISDLKIYDKPKELSEFRTLPCNKSEDYCENCKYLICNAWICETYCDREDGKQLTRPFQSWGYVEDIF